MTIEAEPILCIPGMSPYGPEIIEAETSMLRSCVKNSFIEVRNVASKGSRKRSSSEPQKIGERRSHDTKWIDVFMFKPYADYQIGTSAVCFASDDAVLWFQDSVSRIETILRRSSADNDPFISPGSSFHALGTCKPCAFKFSEGGCAKGTKCMYCHHFHSDEFSKFNLWKRIHVNSRFPITSPDPTRYEARTDFSKGPLRNAVIQIVTGKNYSVIGLEVASPAIIRDETSKLQMQHAALESAIECAKKIDPDSIMISDPIVAENRPLTASTEQPKTSVIKQLEESNAIIPNSHESTATPWMVSSPTCTSQYDAKVESISHHNPELMCSAVYFDNTSPTGKFSAAALHDEMNCEDSFYNVSPENSMCGSYTDPSSAATISMPISFYAGCDLKRSNSAQGLPQTCRMSRSTYNSTSYNNQYNNTLSSMRRSREFERTPFTTQPSRFTHQQGANQGKQYNKHYNGKDYGKSPRTKRFYHRLPPPPPDELPKDTKEESKLQHRNNLLQKPQLQRRHTQLPPIQQPPSQQLQQPHQHPIINENHAARSPPIQEVNENRTEFCVKTQETLDCCIPPTTQSPKCILPSTLTQPPSNPQQQDQILFGSAGDSSTQYLQRQPPPPPLYVSTMQHMGRYNR